MYRRHFGLKDKPFRLTEDSAYYFAAPHQIPSNTLLYAIEERQGLAMVTGLPGMGKTTLLKRLCRLVDGRVRAVLLSDTGASGSSLLNRFAAELGVRARPEELALATMAALRREAARGRTVVLLLDEAQSLTPQQFDEVRLLANLGNLERGEHHRWIEIILSGQPSLVQRLTQPDLASIDQRLTVRSVVEPLRLEQTSDYISHRLSVAGGSIEIFPADAIQEVNERARGVPRLINVLCERALVVAYADNQPAVRRDTIRAAAEDLGPSWGRESLEPVQPVSSVQTDETFDLRERLDRLEDKLDRLLLTLSRAGLMDEDENGETRSSTTPRRLVPFGPRLANKD